MEKIMSTYTNASTMNAPELALAVLEASAQKFNAATENMSAATKTVLMVAGAPLIGLAFIFALPILSVLLSAYYGVRLLAARRTGVAHYVKNVALFFASPFIGLAYILALPVVGLGTLVYLGVKATKK
jgi:uncharacterized membrane protein